MPATRLLSEFDDLTPPRPRGASQKGRLRLGVVHAAAAAAQP